MPTLLTPQVAICYALTRTMSRARSVAEVLDIAIDALEASIGVRRAAILLADSGGTMRAVASLGLSGDYLRAIEAHAPWPAGTPGAEPIVVEDANHVGHGLDTVQAEALLPLAAALAAGRLRAAAFVPLMSDDRVVGAFALQYDVPHAFPADEVQLAVLMAALVAFAVERMRAEEQARRSEERLRFALDAASMGTWEWDLGTNRVRWSENLERIHGFSPGTFDGTFASYERRIHPDDRERVLAEVRRSIEQGRSLDVDYRMVAPDGTIHWCEGKGQVEYADGTPARMSGVCMIVTERKEAELAHLAAVEEASRLKDEFLATLSHEMRTPLNAILGWTEMLQSETLPPDRVRQAIDVIGRNARLQAQLIDDILDVSRIITGKLEIEREPIAVRPLVETVLAGLAPAARARRIALSWHIQDHLPPLEGDRRRLHQVLGNILSNAVKFTPDGGRIELTCSVEDDWVRIEVRDTGAGIAPEFLPYVFDRFRQADSLSTRRYGGLGLGLAIARHLVEQHGGEIRAHSDGPGCGTTIVVRLPACHARSFVDRALARAPEMDEPRLDGLVALVVDDHRDSRELLAAVLEGRGAAVVQCERATDALDALSRGRIDLLVADIAMPEIDGYDLIGRLRAQGVCTPAIAVTAYARPEDRQKALAAGYAACCAKPIDTSHVLEIVGSLLPLCRHGSGGDASFAV